MAQPLEAFELLQRAAVVPLGLRLITQEQVPDVAFAHDAAETLGDGVVPVLAASGFEIAHKFLAQRVDGISVAVHSLVQAGGEEAGFEAGGTEEGLLGDGHALDGEQFLSVDGLVNGDQVGFEVGDGLQVFEADDGEIGGSEAVTARILSGPGLTSRGTRAGGAGGVGAIGGQLPGGDGPFGAGRFGSGHEEPSGQRDNTNAGPDPEDMRDPVTGLRDIDHFATFMRFLAPIARGPVDDTVRNGERVFASIGCAACHVPALATGASSNPLFDRRTVPLFSDLLLHDIGTGDGIRQADSTASPDEMKTPPLWGLRMRRPLLHDGSAATIEDAIARHAGEARLASDGFARLDDVSRAALLAFLHSL